MLIQARPQPRTAPQAPTTPGPATTTTGPATDLASLTSQLADLRGQEAGLRAQHQGLRSQLDQMLQSNPARPGVQQQWADAGVNLAKVQGQIAVVQAKIAQQEGRPVGTEIGIQRPPGRSGPDPDMVVGLSMSLLIIIAIPLSIAWAKRIWRGNPHPPAAKPDEIAPRLDRLEQAVDTIAIEIERISEGQRFVTKILAERPTQSARSDGLNAGTPNLALGAGAAEPIVVPDRDAVRVSR